MKFFYHLTENSVSIGAAESPEAVTRLTDREFVQCSLDEYIDWWRVLDGVYEVFDLEVTVKSSPEQRDYSSERG